MHLRAWRVAFVWLALVTPAFGECAMVGPGCTLYEDAPIVFVGTVLEGGEAPVLLRMRVEEAFRGVKGRTVEVLNTVYEGYSGFEGTGKRYLVFADPFDMDGKRYAKLRDCSRNMVEINRAAALVEQLRRKQRGQRIAALFGRLVRSGNSSSYTAWDPSYTRPLPGVRVTARSGRHTLTTTTRTDGTYAFDRVEPGDYVVSAELPPSLESRQSVTVERGECIEFDATALPTTRLSGRLLGPDGRPRLNTFVSLYRPGITTLPQYVSPASDSVDEAGRFEFRWLPPGDYLLAFGSDLLTRTNPDQPFLRTFHPGVAVEREATVIHLEDGQQIEDADIQLPPPLETRAVRVVLDWNGRRSNEHVPPYVSVSTLGWPPYPRAAGPGEYSVNLLLDVIYRLTAKTSCSGTRREVSTETVTVTGREAPETITLTFPPGGC